VGPFGVGLDVALAVGDGHHEGSRAGLELPVEEGGEADAVAVAVAPRVAVEEVDDRQRGPVGNGGPVDPHLPGLAVGVAGGELEELHRPRARAGGGARVAGDQNRGAAGEAEEADGGETLEEALPAHAEKFGTAPQRSL